MRDRRALVTGGGSGIGLATGRLLVERGASVVLLDRDARAVASGADAIRARAVTADVRSPVEVAGAIAEATELLGASPDLLVNAAGIYRFRPAVETSVEEWDEVLDTNLRGSWFVAREVARALLADGRTGSIVNISSTAGLVADREEPAVAYNASKAGVIAITKQMAVEWAPLIRVNAVCPGVIDTPMLRIMDDPEAGARYVREVVPLQRLGKAGDVAELIVFLASDAAAYVTGVSVPVDGGVTAI